MFFPTFCPQLFMIGQVRIHRKAPEGGKTWNTGWIQGNTQKYILISL